MRCVPAQGEESLRGAQGDPPGANELLGSFLWAQFSEHCELGERGFL